MERGWDAKDGDVEDSDELEDGDELEDAPGLESPLPIRAVVAAEGVGLLVEGVVVAGLVRFPDDGHTTPATHKSSRAVATTRHQIDSSTTLSGLGAPSSGGPPRILFANARTATLEPRTNSSAPATFTKQPAACGSKSVEAATMRARMSLVPSSADSRVVDGATASQRATIDCARASAFEMRGTRSNGNGATVMRARIVQRAGGGFRTPDRPKSWAVLPSWYDFILHQPTRGEPVHDRRLGYRIPFESMVTSYVQDRPIRGLATNLSDTGLNMSTISMVAPPPGVIVPLEIDLPGMNESIWASGRICYRQDDRMASGLGVRFIAMAKSQAKLVRDFCIEMRRKNLGSILARIRA